MSTAAAVLVVLLAHPAWSDRDVPVVERERALRPVAEAIADAARSDVEAAELLALGAHESGNFDLRIVRGHCWEVSAIACDHGRARGVWQPHRETCPAAFLLPEGSAESIRAEAKCAIAQLRFHGRRCREHALTPLWGAFSGYGTGGSCHWAGAGARVLTTRRLGEELRRAEGGS